MGAGEGAKIMKKEYRKYGRLVYCYNPEFDTTIRVDSSTYIAEFDFKFDGWDSPDDYGKCTKKEFEEAFKKALKRLNEVIK